MKNIKNNRLRTGTASIPRQPVVRFQVELLKSRLPEVVHMMAMAGIRTKREFFDNAFSFLQWAIEETAAGNTVGVLTSNQKLFLEWKTPALQVVRRIYETENNRSPDSNGTAPPETVGATDSGSHGTHPEESE